jgi:hypothetical protein
VGRARSSGQLEGPGRASTWRLQVWRRVVRRSWSSSHIGSRAPGPSGPDARRSPVACVLSTSTSFGRHRPRFEVVSRRLRLPRQSDRREPLLGGNVGEGGPTETDEVEHSLSARGWSTRFTVEKPAFPAGNRRGRWRIQPIGY